MTVERIIKNNKVFIIPKQFYYYLILFGFVFFIGGFIIGYLVSQNIFYDKLNYLIETNRILLFNDKYYTINQIFIN